MTNYVFNHRNLIKKVTKNSRIFTILLLGAILFLSANITIQAATFTVTKTADTNDNICDADCSLREAVSAANAASSDDVIEFDAGVFGVARTIQLNGNELIFFNSGSLIINGPNAGLLTINANNASRVFFNEGANLTISNITITSGNGIGSNSGAGGAIFNAFGGTLTLNNVIVTNNSANRAGGIYNIDRSTLVLNNSIINNNTSGFGGGGIYNSASLTINNSVITGNKGGDRGGGLLNTGPTLFDSGGTANIINSTISNNSVESSGGGIANEGVVNLTNSAVSGNSADFAAGGIFSTGSQSISNITNSTVSSNSTEGLGGGIYALQTTINLSYTTVAENVSDSDSNGNGSGGGINNLFGGTVNARNTIIARNIDNSGSAPDFAGTLASQGYNLVGNTLNLTITGTPTGNILGQDALLLPLGSYGGATKTHALQPNSPAIDAAEPNNFPATDQRGLARPTDGDFNGSAAPDIGAYERQPTTFKVSKTTDTDDNICDADCSLREAVAAANATGSSATDSAIIFDAAVFGVSRTITLTLGELKINSNTTFSISGPGAGLLTISAANQSRILFINSGAAVTISKVTLTAGNGNGMESSRGGAVYSNNAALTITDSIFQGNRASFAGGAIYNLSGTLNISNSTISNNVADGGIGGGVRNESGGTMNVNNSTFSGNSSHNGGGIQNSGGVLTINDSTFSGNSAGLGGGIYNFENGTLSIKNSTFGNNTASISGGGIKSAGTLTITNSTISNNSATGGASGGGLSIDQTAHIENSTIVNNRAGFNAGGINNNGTTYIRYSSITGNSSNNRGGGIYNSNLLNIVYSCISGNTAGQFGGGISNSSSLVVAISTVSDNSATGEASSGGGIFNDQLNGFSYIVSSTVAKNRANSGGGGVRNNSGSLAVRNSILGDNSDATGNTPDFSGILFSEGYNLIENAAGTTITGTTTGNIIGRDPRLLPLNNNGGTTRTHALRITSPALDKGNNFGDIYDQRGRPRIFNNPNVPNSSNGTDIGAFEAGPDDLTPAENFDFDGDGKSDIAVFRPSAGSWYLLKSSDSSFLGQSFGLGTDVIAPADYDGDGKTDFAVFRPDSGNWYLQQSTNGFTGIQFGQNGDIPVPADYDGDGRADITVFRPSNGGWYRLNSSNGQFVAVAFGTSEDKPTIGDFDGDGKADIAVFRPSTANWFRLNSSNNQFVAVQFGLAEDKLTPADFDGDGKTDIAVYRPSTGGWYRLNSSNGEFVAVGFGIAEDKPVAADYDGDGKADIAVFRPLDGTWYLLRSTAGFTAVQFGQVNDKPIPNSFVP